MSRLAARPRGRARKQRGIILLLLCVVIATLTGCAAGSQPADSPERSAEGKERWFATPAHLAAGSDLVIRARVADISTGKTYGDAGDEGSQITTRYVDLEVLDVLRGPRLSTVRLEEEGYDADEVGYVANGIRWSKVGDEGYFLLTKSTVGDTYLLVNSYGRLLYQGDRVGPSGHDALRDGKPWAGHGEDLKTRDGIDAALRRAVEAAAELPDTATARAGTK